MMDYLSDKILEYQISDPSEPALLRHLGRKDKSSISPQEILYINRYKYAYCMELFALVNIPLSLFFFARSLDRYNTDALSRRSNRFRFSFVLISQINLLIGSQYYRKVKRYPFENNLVLKYLNDTKNT